MDKIIPQKAGGTPREYRTLKEIRDKIASEIKPYINKRLLPEIEKHFGFATQHVLALKFDVDVEDVGERILNNLSLGFQITDDEESTVALSEAGSGVQSGVLLALHRLAQRAAQEKHTQFILAVEGPEAFLHPQKQKELYQNIRAAQTDNLRVIVTTHSPYIVGETPFSQLGLVRKHGEYSSLHVPAIRTEREREMFDAYSNDLNSLLFFADKLVIVEGECDELVVKLLLQKRFGAAAHKISVVSAAGNRNFSPFLRMIRAWSTAKLPHLIITGFDSLTAETDRAIIRGAKDAGYTHLSESTLRTTVDAALDKGEPEFAAAAESASTYFGNAGLNVFVFTSDLEFSLISEDNKAAVADILNAESTTGNDYSTGYSVTDLKKQIGSKGTPLNPINDPKFKRPYIHKKIAATIDVAHAHADIARLMKAIDEL